MFLDVGLEAESFFSLLGWWWEFDVVGLFEVVDECAGGKSVGVFVAVCGFACASGDRATFITDKAYFVV